MRSAGHLWEAITGEAELREAWLRVRRGHAHSPEVAAFGEAEAWLAEKRGLDVKSEATRIEPSSEGLPFLGLRIWPNAWRLRRERFVRSRRKFRERLGEYMRGEIDEERMAQCAAASAGSVGKFGFRLSSTLQDKSPARDARALRSGDEHASRQSASNASERHIVLLASGVRLRLGVRALGCVPSGADGKGVEK